MSGRPAAQRRAASSSFRSRSAPAVLAAALRGAAIVTLVVLTACQTQLYIPEDLSPAGFFQRAQDASSDRNYQGALGYYEEFRGRFAGDGDEVLRLTWAEYEIAFLHHKLGNDTLAIEQLEALLARYAKPEATAWPRGPETLARRVLVELRAPASGTEADAR